MAAPIDERPSEKPDSSWSVSCPADGASTLKAACQTVTSLLKKAIEEQAVSGKVGWPFSVEPSPACLRSADLCNLSQKVLEDAWNADPHRVSPIISLSPLPTMSAWAVGSSKDLELDSLASPLVLVLADALDALAQLLGDEDELAISPGKQAEPSE